MSEQALHVQQAEELRRLRELMDHDETDELRRQRELFRNEREEYKDETSELKLRHAEERGKIKEELDQQDAVVQAADRKGAELVKSSEEKDAAITDLRAQVQSLESAKSLLEAQLAERLAAMQDMDHQDEQLREK